jgi:hypothetical protein
MRWCLNNVFTRNELLGSVADPHHLDPDPVCHFDADADPDPSFQTKAQNLEKVHSYILACHLQIDADPDPDTAYHFDADPDPTFQFDADPDLQHCFQV